MAWTYMAWLDLETTGLDETEGSILELGIALARPEPPFEEVAAASWVMRPHPTDWRSMMVDKVVEMHAKTGLDVEVDASEFTEAGIEKIAVEWLDSVGGTRGQFLLCGSGVSHFDRRWLKHRMPELEARFGYVTLDVGVIRRGFEVAGIGQSLKFAGKTDGTPHRGLDDARDHLEEWRRYSVLMRAGARRTE